MLFLKDLLYNFKEILPESLALSRILPIIELFRRYFKLSERVSPIIPNKVIPYDFFSSLVISGSFTCFRHFKVILREVILHLFSYELVFLLLSELMRETVNLEKDLISVRLREKHYLLILAIRDVTRL